VRVSSPEQFAAMASRYDAARGNRTSGTTSTSHEQGRHASTGAAAKSADFAGQLAALQAAAAAEKSTSSSPVAASGGATGLSQEGLLQALNAQKSVG